MKKITFLLFAILAFNWQANAQLVFDNTCTTSFDDISATGTDLALTDDGEANITLPFAFTLDGVSSSDLRVGNNGGVLFDATTGDVGTSSSPTLPGFYPFADDIDSDYGSVVWEVLGTAPNRRAVIMWNDRPHYSNSPSGATFELILYETTNEITFLYQDTDFGDGNSNNDAASAGIHVIGANGTYTYSVNTVLAGVTCINWTLPTCPFPVSLSVTNITSTTADLNWTAGGTETSWNIELVDVTAGGTATGTATATGVTNPYSLTGLTASNDYEYYVQADCGGDTSIWAGPFSFRTYGDCSSAGTFTYGNNNDLSNSLNGFVANTPGDYITLTFTAGSTESCCDDWFIVDSADGTGSVIATGSGNIVGSYESTTGEISFYVDSDGSVTGTSFEYEVSCSAPPSCPDPTALLLNNVTTTTADLSWTAGGTETSWNIELVDVTAGGTATGTATATGVTNPYSLTGLSANNDYEYYVQADCGGDTSAWVGPFSFTTLCNPITSYPWSEDFESVSTPDLPNCWSYINNNGDTDYWRTYTTYGVGGSTTAGLYTDFNSGNNDDYLVLPQFTLTGNERLKFSVRARSSSEPNDYRVVLSTLGSTPTDFTEELLPLTQVSSTTQTEITPIDLSGYTGDVFIAIHVPSGGLDGYYIYFDEFVVEPIPSCIEPSALTASNITSSSADLSWAAGGTETSWNIELVDVTAGGTATGIATTTGVTNPYPLTGLTANNDYEYYVQANCGGDTSVWVGPFSFTTFCEAFSSPYTEGFENAGSIPDCWENQGAEDWNFSNTGSGNHIGANGTITGTTTSNGYFAWVDSSGTEADAILLSPFIDVSTLTTPSLSFYELSDNEGNANSQLDVEVWDGSSWNNMATYNTNTAGWELKIIDLSSLTITGDIQVKFIFTETTTGDYYDDIAIDDVTVDELPSCLAPSTLVASSITSSSADLSWTAGGTETLWNIELVDVTAGGTVTGTATATGITNPYSLTGLAAGNDYEYYVQADCGGDTSAWVGPFAFSTFGDCSSAGTFTYGNNNDLSNSLNGFASSTPGDYITLTFTAGSTESCCDTWYVVDSTDGTGNVIASGTGSIVGSYESSTGEISFYVDSDGSVTGSAFEYSLSCSTLSTTNFEQDVIFNYYPNPVKDNFTISAQKEISNISIYNMVGQEVYLSQPNKTLEVVNMSNLQTGAYFVKLQIGTTLKTIKVIKK